MKLPLNIDFQQVFLHMFNFVILIGGLYILLYKPVKDFMDKRLEYYKNLDKENSDKLAEANLLKQQYTEKLKLADEEITEKKTQAARESSIRSKEELDKTRKEAQKIVNEAQDQANREREKILAQARNEIADMAAQVTQKILMESAPAAFDEFLDSAEGSVKNE